jgi:hypothetical protein
MSIKENKYMQKFVIQEHTTENETHWDLMLQQGEALATWQVSIHPTEWPGKNIPCWKIFDHRLMYLEYEGPLGQNRGEVKIFTAGTYQIIKIEKNNWSIRLKSDIISGNLIIKLIQDDQWELHLQGDKDE